MSTAASYALAAPHKANKAIRIIVTLAMLVLCLFILTQAVPGLAFIKFRMVSTAMQIPMQIVYFSQVLMFAFLCISLIMRLIQLIAGWNDREEDLPEWESELKKMER